MKILILCTGNSVRSQMAEGFLKSFDASLEVESAGTVPGRQVHPFAVKVMRESGIDILHARPKSVDQFLHDSFDYVITVCDYARESCPSFTGQVKHRLHMGFEDPAATLGSQEQVLSEFRQVRDQIGKSFRRLYTNTLTRKS